MHISGRLRWGLATLFALAAMAVCTAVASAAPPTGVSANALDARVDVALAARRGRHRLQRLPRHGGRVDHDARSRPRAASPPRPTWTPRRPTARRTSTPCAPSSAASSRPTRWPSRPAAASTSCTAGNAVVVENCRPGRSNWTLRNASAGIEGFATAQSIDNGESVDLKVNSTAVDDDGRRDLPHGLLRRRGRAPPLDAQVDPRRAAAGLQPQHDARPRRLLELVGDRDPHDHELVDVRHLPAAHRPRRQRQRQLHHPRRPRRRPPARGAVRQRVHDLPGLQQLGRLVALRLELQRRQHRRAARRARSRCPSTGPTTRP